MSRPYHFSKRSSDCPAEIIQAPEIYGESDISSFSAPVSDPVAKSFLSPACYCNDMVHIATIITLICYHYSAIVERQSPSVFFQSEHEMSQYFTRMYRMSDFYNSL